MNPLPTMLLMARSHTRSQTRILIRRGFPTATVVLCLNFTVHRFRLRFQPPGTDICPQNGYSSRFRDGYPYLGWESESVYVNKPQGSFTHTVNVTGFVIDTFNIFDVKCKQHNRTILNFFFKRCKKTMTLTVHVNKA